MQIYFRRGCNSVSEHINTLIYHGYPPKSSGFFGRVCGIQPGFTEDPPLGELRLTRKNGVKRWDITTVCFCLFKVIFIFYYYTWQVTIKPQFEEYIYFVFTAEQANLGMLLFLFHYITVSPCLPSYSLIQTWWITFVICTHRIQ